MGQRRRVAVGAGAALVAVLLVLAWSTWWRPDLPDRLGSRASAASSTSGPAWEILAAAERAASGGGVGVGGAAVGPAPVAPGASSSVSDRLLWVARVVGLLPVAWDLCGVGVVPVPRDAVSSLAAAAASAAANGAPQDVELGMLPGLPSAMGQGALARALDRTRVVMRAGSPRARGAELLLERTQETEDMAKRLAGFPQIDQLAQTSGDRVLARWSAAFCHTSADKDCVSRTRRWAHADPDNGAAWAELWAVTAQQPQEALAGLTASRRYATYWGAVAAEVLNAVPADVPTYLHHALAQQGLLAEGLVPMPSFQWRTKICNPKRSSGEVPIECQDLIELMVGGESNLLERRIGAGMGERLGWPAERVQAVRRLTDQAIEAAGIGHLKVSQPFSCDAVEPDLQMWRSMATKGEVQALLDHPAVAARLRSAASAPAR